MARVIHNFIQGSDEWLAHRATPNMLNASELAAMLGLDKKMSRQELVRMKATGSEKEFSDFVRRHVLDKGHENEDLARPIAESIVGEDIAPRVISDTIDGVFISASLDGTTFMGDRNWEHKSLNADLAASMDKKVIPEEYHPQMEGGFMVSGATECLFMASTDGNADTERHLYYKSNPELRKRIIKEAKQFWIDVSEYEHSTEEVKPAAEPVKDLPAVLVTVSGKIDIQDNFKVFEDALTGFIGNVLIKHPKTDQDFADLDSQIKALRKAESALDAAEANMLAQVETVNDAKRTKDRLHEMARNNRLMAEKLLTAEKANRRNEILQDGVKASTDHIEKLNVGLGGKIKMPAVEYDFAGAMKGKKTITTLKDAVAGELARFKIAANEVAEKIRANIDILKSDAERYETLFADAQQLVMKDGEDLKNLIATRIAEHKLSEQERLDAEREKIRKEEEEKAEAKVAAKTTKTSASYGGGSSSKAVVASTPKTSDAEEDIVFLLRREAMTAPDKYAKLLTMAADTIECMRG